MTTDDIISPTVMTFMLGNTLQELREAAGITAKAAAQAIDCTPPKISHLETGRYVVKWLELPALLNLYGASDRLAELESLRHAATENGWWSAWNAPSWLKKYIGLEAGATEIRYFMQELLPGLTQTADYTREIYLRHGQVSGEELERLVELRMQRQRRVREDLKFTLVASEAVLHRNLHTAIGVAQLRHLVELVEVGKVDLRVLPFTAGGHLSMGGSFSFMSFPTGTLPTIAFCEGIHHVDMSDAPGAVQELEGKYRSLLCQSLGQADSAKLLTDLLSMAAG